MKIVKVICPHCEHERKVNMPDGTRIKDVDTWSDGMAVFTKRKKVKCTGCGETIHIIYR